MEAMEAMEAIKSRWSGDRVPVMKDQDVLAAVGEWLQVLRRVRTEQPPHEL